MNTAVHRLHLATVWPGDDRVDVYGYLVVMPDHAILVDTGVGDDSPMIDRLFRPQHQSISEQLARHGVQTTDISIVINSHLHYDHCGNNRLFPDANIIVQSHEVLAAHQPNYTVADWFDYDGARLREVSGDAQILPNVRVIASHGHTPGHQSVLIEDAPNPILIAAQATYSAAEYQAGGDTSQAHEGLETVYRETVASLKSLKPRCVYFSHDDMTVEPE